MARQKLMDKLMGARIGAQLGAQEMRVVGETLEEQQVQIQELQHEVREASGAAEIELMQDSKGWTELTGRDGKFRFSRAFIDKIITLSRMSFILNPLIRRAVTVQELYVWGSGVTIKGDNPEVTGVLDDFFQHPKNQGVIGEAWPEREREQRIDGNTFFSIYRNKANGSARIRCIPTEQIEDIICNPEDSKEPWFYIRAEIYQEDGSRLSKKAIPCIDYQPKNKPPRVKDIPIDWDYSIIHLKTGGFSFMKYGLPELFSSIIWAIGYKSFLENFSKIHQAFARLAMKITQLPGKKGAAAMKSAMNTAMGPGVQFDTNPPNNTAGWAALYGKTNVEPIKTAHSTTGPDEARALRSMVASGSDTPEHFFGDSDIGNFATSTTLDRPTELKMISRQEMWSNFVIRLGNKLLVWSAQAPQGKLKKAGYSVNTEQDPFDGIPVLALAPPNGKNGLVIVEFPTIIQRDVVDRVRAVVQAATLGGSTAEGIIPNRKYLCSLLIKALGEQNAELVVDKLYPKDVSQGFIDPADMTENERIAALSKKALGDAALTSADASLLTAKKPAPKITPAKAK